MSNHITGKDLIDMGYKPAKWFGQVLAAANAGGMDSDAIREMANEYVAQETKIIPTQSGLDFARFINPENGAEADNAEAVFATMHELMKTPTVVAGAVMPDACPAGSSGTIPVGGVVSTRNAVHPGMHSADVCCSLMTTDLGDIDPARALDIAHELCHFGPGGHREPVDTVPNEMIDRISKNPFYINDVAIDLARHHLRTIGASNHFVYVGRSETTGNVCLATHHGSRGFGAHLFKNGMKTAEAFRKKHSPDTLKQNAWIELDSQDGADYMDGLSIAHDWTRLNHASLHDAVLSALGIDGQGRLFSPHNFVFRDPKDPAVIHHAKGATPVEADMLTDRHDTMIIPMNMAEPVLLVQPGAGNTTGFAPHGAGRVMTRTAHRKLHEGVSEEELVARETKGVDARFYCGIPDTSELPSAYKSAASVQRDMQAFGLADVVDRIMPFGCIMAGDIDRNAPWRRK